MTIRTRSSVTWLSLSLLSLALSACGGAFAEGKAEFKKGHYPHAKELFASVEGDSRRYDDARRAEYALYRGLTLAALGDRGQASVWLREAKAIDDTHPGSLSKEDALRLKAAMENGE
jgi:hypothetical protein